MFGATLSDVDLKNANLEGAVYEGFSERSEPNQRKPQRCGSARGRYDRRGQRCFNGNERSDLTTCLMDYAQGTRAKMANDFQGASLVGANLEGAQLFGSDLSTSTYHMLI